MKVGTTEQTTRGWECVVPQRQAQRGGTSLQLRSQQVPSTRNLGHNIQPAAHQLPPKQLSLQAQT